MLKSVKNAVFLLKSVKIEKHFVSLMCPNWTKFIKKKCLYTD